MAYKKKKKNVKLSGLEGLVTYFQLTKIISWNCNHKKSFELPIDSVVGTALSSRVLA